MDIVSNNEYVYWFYLMWVYLFFVLMLVFLFFRVEEYFYCVICVDFFDGEVFGRFVIFLWFVCGDKEIVERVFRVVVVLDFINFYYVGNYFYFLWYLEDEYCKCFLLCYVGYL